MSKPLTTLISRADHRQDPAAWAKQLGTSTDAVALYLACEVIDLHIDTFIWARLLGYDLHKRHGRGPFLGRYYSQVDLPRIHEAQISGAMWSITTQPWRSAPARLQAFEDNVVKLRALLTKEPERVAIVSGEREYRAARAAGKHAAMIVVQGGNAFDHDLTALDRMSDDSLLSVTLLHMTDSALGQTSSPARRGTAAGLGHKGRDCIAALNARRVFVDLAHIGRAGFFEAVDAHDKSQPLIVTHTGVNGVHRSWRNLDDDQLRAVADTGGVIGVVYHGEYLCGRYWSGGTAKDVVAHLAHVIDTVGEDHAALGSDWDGLIVTPQDMRTCLELPVLVQRMLDHGFGERVIRKVLGENFLRSLAQLRPGR